MKEALGIFYSQGIGLAASPLPSYGPDEGSIVTFCRAKGEFRLKQPIPFTPPP